MIILFFFVFFFTLLSVLLIRPIAIRFGLVDTPTLRKSHFGNIPLVGGIAMFIGVSSGFLFFFEFNNLSNYYAFFLSAFILVILGTVDDFHDISFALRFLLQITAAFILISIGNTGLLNLGDILSFGEIGLGGFSLLFSIIAIVAVVNSLNFSDGIDGLAASTSLVTFSSIAFFAYIAQNVNGLSIAIIFVASILAFLIFNIGNIAIKRLKIFMGDSGSMFLGLSIAWLLVSLSQGEDRAFSPVAALWIYSIPLMDSFSILVRRLSVGQSPFLPDRKHLHHLFLTIGYSDKQALMIIIIFSLLMASVGIIMELKGIAEFYMFIYFIIIAIIYSFITIFVWRAIKN